MAQMTTCDLCGATSIPFQTRGMVDQLCKCFSHLSDNGNEPGKFDVCMECWQRAAWMLEKAWTDPKVKKIDDFKRIAKDEAEATIERSRKEAAEDKERMISDYDGVFLKRCEQYDRDISGLKLLLRDKGG